MFQVLQGSFSLIRFFAFCFLALQILVFDVDVELRTNSFIFFDKHLQCRDSFFSLLDTHLHLPINFSAFSIEDVELGALGDFCPFFSIDSKLAVLFRFPFDRDLI